MIENKEIAILKIKSTKLENQANTINIISKEDYLAAGDIAARLKDLGSTIKNKKESITKPLNESLRNIRDLFAPLESQFKNAEIILKNKLLDYQHKIQEEVRAKEAKIAARVEKGNLRVETAEKKIEQIERIDSTTQGLVGEVQLRKIKKVRIINGALIPREYLVPDMTSIRRDALGGRDIPGIEVYTEDTIAVGSI